MFPSRRHAADLRLAAVGEDDDGVVPEQLRDGALVIPQIVLIGVLRSSVALLEFDEDQRQPIDEPDQIGPAFINAARDPELRSQKEVVVLRLVPVDDPHGFAGFVSLIVLKTDPHAFFQQSVDFPVAWARLMALRSLVSSSMAS